MIETTVKITSGGRRHALVHDDTRVITLEPWLADAQSVERVYQGESLEVARVAAWAAVAGQERAHFLTALDDTNDAEMYPLGCSELPAVAEFERYAGSGLRVPCVECGTWFPEVDAAPKSASNRDEVLCCDCHEEIAGVYGVECSDCGERFFRHECVNPAPGLWQCQLCKDEA